MKKDLNRNTRGVKHYLNLKQDFENESDRLFDSLPLFYRIMFLDQPNPWIQQINRFDFLRLAVVSSDFNDFQKTLIGKFLYKKIDVIDKKMILEIKLEDFFQSTILKTAEFNYTIQEFLLMLAYNGGLHMKPDKKDEEKSTYIYDNLFEEFPDFTFTLVKSISKILIEIFDEFHSLLVGNNDGHSPNSNFQAMIVKDGKLLDGIYFKRAFMQFPIRQKKNKGIRISLVIKLLSLNNSNRNHILWYGNRLNKELNIGIYQSKTKLIIQILDSKTIVLDITKLLDMYFLLELCLYPNGKISVATNQTLNEVEDLNKNINIIDGKIILGTNLSGTHFGEFYEQMIAIQSIDKLNETRNLGIYGLKKMNIQSRRIPYNLLKRET
mgnify:CR=1 FL=1|tara:strand:- start:179 stop:1318 length:1140 start_codon:yes stop_codon:yes gene_type:complete